jgi:hypothetical protein
MVRLEALTRFFGLTARSPNGRTNFDKRTRRGREFRFRKFRQLATRRKTDWDSHPERGE